jgi:hypothetical protein
MRRERERAEYVAAHGNVCELCGNEPKTRGLHDDHAHRTGEHRGWLCWRCNNALPSWMDSAWLLKAAAYLARSEGHSLKVAGAERDSRDSYSRTEALRDGY